MKTVTKVAAVLVMILSGLLVLVMLAGIGGAWWANGELRGIVTNLAAVGDNALERAQGVVGQVNAQVIQSQERLASVSAGIEKAGAKAEETNLALLAAEKLLDQDLAPTIERLTERVADLRATLQVVEGTVALWRRLPGSADNELLAAADVVLGKIEAVGQGIAQARESIRAAKSQATGAVVTTLTGPINQVSARLGEASGNLTQLDGEIDAEQAQLAALRDRVNRLITLAVVVLTLAFLWMALAQVGLFIHAYGVFTGRDPLARWHRQQGDGPAGRLEGDRPAPEALAG